MTPDSLARLKALAEAATKGDWNWITGDELLVLNDANTAHVIAFRPDAALELLATLARLTEREQQQAIYAQLGDGVERLVKALHNRAPQSRDYLGGTDANMLHEAATELIRLQGEIETLKDNYNTLLEAHTFEVARARTAEARAEAAEREVERLTKEREGLSKDYGNLLAESNAHETATQAEQEKAQRLREWLPSVFDVDSLIGRVLIGKLDALGFAPTTPQEPK